MYWLYAYTNHKNAYDTSPRPSENNNRDPCTRINAWIVIYKSQIRPRARAARVGSVGIDHCRSLLLARTVGDKTRAAGHALTWRVVVRIARASARGCETCAARDNCSLQWPVRRSCAAATYRVMDKHYVTGPDPALRVVLAPCTSYRCNVIFCNGASDVILGARNASITQTHAAAPTMCV